MESSTGAGVSVANAGGIEAETGGANVGGSGTNAGGIGGATDAGGSGATAGGACDSIGSGASTGGGSDVTSGAVHGGAAGTAASVGAGAAGSAAGVLAAGAVTVMSPSGWWQATKWVGRTSRIIGSSLAQISVAAGHRVRKRHPDGGERGDGISPPTPPRSVRFASGSGSGIALRRAAV